MFEKFKEWKAKVKGKFMVASTAASVAVMSTGVMAFASEPSGGSSLPSIAITQEMLSPLVEGVMANLAVIIPVGIAVFAGLLGVRMIPTVFRRFFNV